jgi:hypothetical protein
MLHVGNKVVYGKGMKPGGAKHPSYVGKSAEVLYVDPDEAMCVLRFEDGFVHKSCPFFWAKKEE